MLHEGGSTPATPPTPPPSIHQGNTTMSEPLDEGRALDADVAPDVAPRDPTVRGHPKLTHLGQPKLTHPRPGSGGWTT